MAKDNGGKSWSFPKDTEIFKCRDGRKEFMRERAASMRGNDYRLIAEFPVYSSGEDKRAAWKLAKRVARDHLRNSWMQSALVTYVQRDTYGHEAVKVYEKISM
ncbi:MAG: hypothetical protein LBD02_00980 [Christensenellaceae bacterium]|jgi:hypothetical protein|nr:hypothetical protein [Christensenellaceae bacterium]